MRQSYLLLVGLFIGAAIVAWLPPAIFRPSEVEPTPVATPRPTPRVIQIDLEEARLVHRTIYSEMRYTVHLIGKGTPVEILGRPILEKEVLVITTGSCSAGVDYDQKPAIVEAVGAQAAVKIPEPRLLGCGVTSVTFFDGKGLLPAPTELYNDLYDQAAQEIQARAEESDLLSKARDNARAQVELYLRRLGFEQVSVTIAGTG